MKRLLAISPHPDDVEFGLGGLLHCYQDSLSVRTIVLSDRTATRGEADNESEQRAAMERLGVTDVLFVDEMGFERFPIRFMDAPEQRDRVRALAESLVADYDPDWIFVPGIRETMQDHAAVGQEFVRVIRQGRAMIFGYEVPRHNRDFRPDVFIEVTEDDLAAKCEAVACFRQFTNRYYFAREVIDALAVTRASDAGFRGRAEAFELYRAFMPLSGGLNV